MYPNTSPINLTDAQRAQFETEMDRFAETIRDRIDNPVVSVVVAQTIEQAKARPEETLGLLVHLGTEISEAVQRIKAAAPPQL